MKIRNAWSLAASVSIAIAVTACSGNPVDTNTTDTKSKASVKKIAKAPIKSKNTVPVTKTIVVARATKPSSKPPAGNVRPLKTKALSRAEVRAKKQSIAALGKSKQAQEQARLKYIRAKARIKYLENQKLAKKKTDLAARKRLNRSIQLARAAASAAALGLDRFRGSQADEPVVPQRVVTKARTRVVQRVATRSQQPVVTRSQQSVRVRAQQAIAARSAVDRRRPRLN